MINFIDGKTEYSLSYAQACRILSINYRTLKKWVGKKTIEPMVFEFGGRKISGFSRKQLQELKRRFGKREKGKALLLKP